jgi:hypothetical protein
MSIPLTSTTRLLTLTSWEAAVKPKLVVFVCLLASSLLTACTAKAGIAIVGGLTHARDVKIGESYQGVIFIKNDGEEDEEVKITQSDYLFFFYGKTIYGEPGKTRRSNANWIEFSPDRVLISPGGVSSVNYVVKVPDDGTLVGTYWSMLLVERIPKTSPESVLLAKRQKNQLGITTVLRYGIQVVTSIGDTGTRELRFLETKLVKAGRTRSLQVDVENPGERWLRALLWTELFDERGSYVGRFEGDRLRTFPGTSVRYTIDLSQVPEGRYDALVVADCGGEDVFGATLALELER